MSSHQPVAAIAWGESCVTHLEGRAGLVFAVPFELIPGGTMANGRAAKHGLVHIDTHEIPEGQRHDPDAPLHSVCIDDPATVMAAGITTASELAPYVDQIVDGFRLHLNAQIVNSSH